MPPPCTTSPACACEAEAELAAALERIKRLTADVGAAATAAQPAAEPAGPVDAFTPIEPASFRAADLTDSEVEALILKFLVTRGDATGRDIADQVKLPFVLVHELLRTMKNDQLVGHRGSAPMNDFVYQLTDLGRERGRRYAHICTYFGAAPVSLRRLHPERHRAVADQAASHAEDLERAFTDLLLNKSILDRLGPAINSGRGLFLFGPPATARRASPSGLPPSSATKSGCPGRSAWVGS